MPLRIPVNPQTAPPSQLQSFTSEGGKQTGAAALGAGLEDFGKDIEKVQTRMEDKALLDQRQQEQFELSHKILVEKNNLDTTFQDKLNAPDAGSADFVPNISKDLESNRQTLVTQAAEAGYHPEAVRQFALSLDQLNSQYIGQAAQFQTHARVVNTLTGIDNNAEEFGRQAALHPELMDSIRDQLKQNIDNAPYIDEPTKQEQFEKQWAQVRAVGGQAYARDHPLETLQHLAPQLIPPPVAAMPGTLGGYTGGKITAEQMLPLTVAQESHGNYAAVNKDTGALGRYQIMPATGQGLAKQLGVPWQPALMKQNTPEARAYQDKLGLAAIQSSVAAADGDPAGAFSHYYSGSTSAYAKPGNPKTAQYVKDMMGRLGTVQAQPLVANDQPPTPANDQSPTGAISNPQGYVALVPPMTQIDPNNPDAGPIEPAAAPAGPAEAKKTGVPALDYLTGAEQLQVVGEARSVIAQQQAALRQEAREQSAAEKQAIAQKVDALETRLFDGKATQVDIDNARQQGWLFHYEDIKRMQGILDSKNKKDEDLDRFSLMYNTGGAFNPFDKDSRDAVEAGFDKALKIASDGHTAATPLSIAMDIWKKTGILPKQGATLLRGGLASADLTTLAASASVAATMQNHNPQVFAGIDGGEEIAKAASNYQHLIDDLGMTGQEAAARMAAMNKPEAKAAHLADPVRQQFVKALAATPIEGTLDKALGNTGWFSSSNHFVAPPQLAEAQQTYNELALNHFEQFHDQAAAQAYAQRQMTRLYGIVDGRLMKFPPTTAYPAVGGSHDYVFQQAREEVIKHTGLDIPVNRVWLQPAPSGATAQAFRSGGQVPYQIWHITKTHDGHEVYDTIPGKLFVADVGKAKAEAATEAKTYGGRIRLGESGIPIPSSPFPYGGRR